MALSAAALILAAVVLAVALLAAYARGATGAGAAGFEPSGPAPCGGAPLREEAPADPRGAAGTVAPLPWSTTSGVWAARGAAAPSGAERPNPLTGAGATTWVHARLGPAPPPPPARREFAADLAGPAVLTRLEADPAGASQARASRGLMAALARRPGVSGASAPPGPGRPAPEEMAAGGLADSAVSSARPRPGAPPRGGTLRATL